MSGKLPPHLLEYILQGEDVPRLVGQIRQQFGLLERDIALRLKLREAQSQEAANDTDVDRIMGGNLPLLVRHARAFGLRRLVSSLSTHGVEVGAAGEEGGGKGGGETMSSMRLSVLVPRYLCNLSTYSISCYCQQVTTYSPGARLAQGSVCRRRARGVRRRGHR